MGTNKAAGEAPKELPRTRVVLIIDEETGELDYFIMRGKTEVIVLEEPGVAIALAEEAKRCH